MFSLSAVLSQAVNLRAKAFRLGFGVTYSLRQYAKDHRARAVNPKP